MDANARDGKASHVAYKNQSKEEKPQESENELNLGFDLFWEYVNS